MTGDCLEINGSDDPTGRSPRNAKQIISVYCTEMVGLSILVSSNHVRDIKHWCRSKINDRLEPARVFPLGNSCVQEIQKQKEFNTKPTSIELMRKQKQQQPASGLLTS